MDKSMEDIKEFQFDILKNNYIETYKKINNIENFFKQFATESDFRSKNYYLSISHASWIINFCKTLAFEIKEDKPALFEAIFNDINKYLPEIEVLSEKTNWSDFYDYSGVGIVSFIYNQFSGYIDALNVFNFGALAETMNNSIQKIKNS